MSWPARWTSVKFSKRRCCAFSPSGGPSSPRRLEDHIVEALESAIEAATPRGVTIGVENEHACNMATGAEVAAALRRLPSPRLGLVWDPANSYVAGVKPFPDDYAAVPADRIAHVHAKDGVMPAGSDRMQWGLVGAGDVNWPCQLAALVRDGYHGAVSLETHWGGPGGDKFQGSLECVEALKRLVAAA